MATHLCATSTSRLLSEIDSVTLEEVLVGIGACELDIEELFSIEYPPRDDARTIRRSEVCNKRGPQPYRPRHETVRKMEMQRLRSQIEELQDMLAQTQWRRDPTPRFVWSHIARDQRRLRCEAETRNQELRRLVLGFRGDVKKMERLFGRNNRLLGVIPRALRASRTGGPHRGPKVDPLYQFQRLNRLTVEEEQMFAGGISAESISPSCLQKFRFVDSSSGSSSLEIILSMRWELPFGSELVANAMWTKLTKVASKKKCVASEVVYSDSSSILTQFIAKGEGAIGEEHGRMAARRQPVAKGVLLLSSVQLHVLLDKNLKGFAESDNWVRVTETSTVAGVRSSIQWCCRGLLQPSAASHPSRSQWIQQVTTAVHSKRERKIDKMLRSIENLALDASLAKKKNVLN